MTKFAIEASYIATTRVEKEIPVENWDEIKEFYVKWDVLHYCLKADPGKWLEIVLDSDSEDIIDWKRPDSTEVFEVEEDGSYGESVHAD